MNELPINKVLVGDCREVLEEFPEESIDFCMFSPPYYGLRDYGEEAGTIWDGKEDCNHEFFIEEKEHPLDRGGNVSDKQASVRESSKAQGAKVRDGFCKRCSAWRGQLGLEPDYKMYVKHLVEVGKKIRRVLKPTGTWFLNIGDTYSSSHRISQEELPKKCKMLIPYRVAIALIDDGWILRNDLTWIKVNPMPHSVEDRLNTTTEAIFFFVKQKQYYFDLDKIRVPHKKNSLERIKHDWNGKRPDKVSWKNMDIKRMCHPKGKNPGDVIELSTRSYSEAHFAVYPTDLTELPMKAGCPEKVCKKCGTPYEKKFDEEHSGATKSKYDEELEGFGQSGLQWEGPSKKKFEGWEKQCDCDTEEAEPGIVLDPMCGAGSTLKKAEELGFRYTGIEINSEYADLAKRRVKKTLNDKVPKKKREAPEDTKILDSFTE